MPASAQNLVAALLPKLRSERVTFFPIRHHSPACAGHLQRWISQHRPKAVLVEGPGSFTRRIDFLLDERTHCPVAFYTTFVDVKGRLGTAEATGDAEERIPGFEPRFAAYYPLCDYSPELVALRAGRAVGARLRFIDLEYGEMILARHQHAEPSRDSVRVGSLTDDAHLKHSEYVQALAKRLHCRDFDEAWDHLFEASWEDVSTDVFIDRVATYCAMARLDYSDETLRRDGTLTREACMAAAVVEEMELGGPVLVVTGGVHTVALPDLVAHKTRRPEPIDFSEPEGGTWLMRYSFDQLDALAGYSAGMPSPDYYNRCWHAAQASSGNNGTTKSSLERIAADIAIEIGRITRERQLPDLVTTPDTIAAVQMTKQLAALRGHPWPLREDILDGIRCCFIKGELTVEGQMLQRLVREVLAGNRIGQLPPDGDLPPIVADFHQEARRFRLSVDRVEKKKYTLELYREANDRGLSRFLHRLDLLGAPFGQFAGGPDFVTGQGLELMQEHWEVGWSPMVESALIKASVFGPTIADAAAAKLQQQIAALEEEGKGRSADAAVTILIRACRLGLHAQAAALVPVIDVHIAEDPVLLSVAQGLSQLDLLAKAREPLGAGGLTALPPLLQAAYQRACRLVYDVAGCPDEAVDGVVRALQILREILASSPAASSSSPAPSSADADNANQEPPPLDADLFFQGLRNVVEGPPQQAQPAVIGAAAGILYGEGRYTEEKLVRTVQGFLGGTASQPRKIAGILRGLLGAAREIAWQVTGIIRAVDAQFQAWDDNAFLNLLPELRLAFTSLTPREIARVADHLSALHQGATLGEIVHMDLDEKEVELALAVDGQVRESLRVDGLTR
jgi:hypothetical protein